MMSTALRRTSLRALASNVRRCSTVPAFRDIDLTTHDNGKRATLTLNRPNALNALTANSMQELVAAANFLDSLPEDNELDPRGRYSMQRFADDVRKNRPAFQIIDPD